MLSLADQETTERLGVPKIPGRWQRLQAYSLWDSTALLANSHPWLIRYPWTFQHHVWKRRRKPRRDSILARTTCSSWPWWDPEALKQFHRCLCSICGTKKCREGSSGFPLPSRAHSGFLSMCFWKQTSPKLPTSWCACSMCPRKWCVIVVAEDAWFSCSFLTNYINSGLFRLRLPSLGALFLTHPFCSFHFHDSFLFHNCLFFLSYSYYTSACNHSLYPLNGMHEQKIRCKQRCKLEECFTPFQFQSSNVMLIAEEAWALTGITWRRLCRELRGDGRITIVQRLLEGG